MVNSFCRQIHCNCHHLFTHTNTYIDYTCTMYIQPVFIYFCENICCVHVIDVEVAMMTQWSKKQEVSDTAVIIKKIASRFISTNLSLDIIKYFTFELGSA